MWEELLDWEVLRYFWSPSGTHAQLSLPCEQGRESHEITVSKISKYLEENIPVINHSTNHIDRSNIVVNPQICFPGFPLAKSPFLQESRSKHQGQIGRSHTVAKNLGKTKWKVVDSKVLMKVIQMKTAFYSFLPLPLFLWLFFSHILPYMSPPTALITLSQSFLPTVHQCQWSPRSSQ